MNAPIRRNPYLAGNYAPIRSEDNLQDLPIAGLIPETLCGTFFRNGPNPQFEPRDANYHWFSGDGMIHAFRLDHGRVNYFNRYVHTTKWQLEHEAGRALYGTFGNPMTSDPAVIGKDSTLANTNIVWHAGRLLALEEGHQPFELDPVTLAARGYRDYAGAAKRFTAHPKIDPETGELVFFGYSTGDMPFGTGMAYGVVDASGKVTRLESFEAPFASMVHDFLVTRRHALFPILPLTGSLERAMKGAPPYAWEPEKGAHIGVMARDGSPQSIRWFTTDPCYVFHPMNAWEADGKIFADVMQYDTPPLFPNADGSPLPPSAATLWRWTFDLGGKSNAIKREKLDDLAGEFPRFDERRAGLSYRHGYFAANSKNERKVSFDAIAHYDCATGKRATYVFPNGDFVGEPVFVPRAPNSPEGDGYLVAVVYRGSEDRSDFVVFDAQDVPAGPIGTAKLPRRVPFGFHGNWMPK